MTLTNRSSSGLSGLRALCFASVAFGAVSAAAAEAPAAAPASGATLSEVMVTARKTSQNVQNVPLTVNVLDTTALINQGIANLSDISAHVSNLEWDSAGGSSNNSLRMSIRGIASGASQFGFEPGIGVYVDDVYLGNEIGFNNSLLDIDRIEVLKGPQGTLFGRNTVAGAVSIHTRSPSIDQTYLDADVSAGNYNLADVRLVGNVPTSADSALKLSTIYRVRDGFLFDATTGKRNLNNENHWGLRAQWLWKPTSDFILLATADYFHDKGNQESQICFGTGTNGSICNTASNPLALFGGAVVATGTVNHPTRDSTTDGRAEDNSSEAYRTMWSTSLNTTWTGWGKNTLTSITSYRNLKSANDQDQDYTSLNLIRSGYNVPKDWQFSEELRLASDQEARLRGVAGLFYYHEDRHTILPLTDTALALQIVGIATNVDHTSLTDATQITDSYAVFGQVYYDILPTLTIDAGLRYSEDRKAFTYVSTIDSVFSSATSLGPPLAVPLTHTMASFGDTTGEATLSWHVAKESMLYFHFSRGFKSGGFNDTQSFSAATLPTHPFGPETLDQYEVGLKAQGFEDRVRFNAAAFKMYYSNMQVNFTDPNTRSQFVFNAGDSRSEGAEAELTVLPIAHLTFDANAGVQHAKFTSFAPGGPVNLLGKDTFFAPHTTASVSTTYDRAVAEGVTGLASVTVAYRSDMFLDQQNTVRSRAVMTLNGRLGADFRDGKYGFYLWGANLTDARRITAFTNPKFRLDAGSVRLSDPRTFGVELKAHF